MSQVSATGKSENFQTPNGRFKAAAVVSISSRSVTAQLTFRCYDLASTEDDSGVPFSRKHAGVPFKRF